MTARGLRVAVALVAATALTTLAGCTPSAVDEGGREIAPTAGSGFSCPSAERIGSLTAIPFGLSAPDPDTCEYTARESEDEPRVVIRHGAGGAAPGLRSLTEVRTGIAAQEAVRVRDAARFSADAFTVMRLSGSCSIWVYAADGVITTVTARLADPQGSPCALAQAAATVMGTAEQSVRPLVTVIASDGLLAATDTTAHWTTDLERALDVRVRVIAGDASGYLRDGDSTSFADSAGRVDRASAAVVFVSGAADAGRPRLDLLRAATRAYSTADAEAPAARFVVVGPVADSAASPASTTRLRTDLRLAARIAGAGFVDPSTDASGAVVAPDLRARSIAAADRVKDLLRPAFD